ncbi:MAG: hemerythrin domain-containing protein [Elusimicrobia bacterium]|nr:hemerythrin domain-containing protein [Elusimicrobiota bacterium]
MTISEFFQKDHREIDAIFEAIPFEQPQLGTPAFEEFDRRLERHIIWEEEILFPGVCAKEPCLAQGPIQVMKLEHVEIRERKAASLACLRAGDGAAARRHAKAMLETLAAHNMKEEQILYPACDELLDESERLALLSRVRASGERKAGG